ncbi:MAG: 50S ribosomal protein L3 [archaeon]
MTRWKGKPRAGSRAYSPRKRAASQSARVRSWPVSVKSEKPVFLAGFAGYKAGMTHCFAIDNRKDSHSSGKEIMLSCTVLETPPLVLFGARAYKKTPYGLVILSETYSSDNSKYVLARVRPGKPNANFAQESAGAYDIRALLHTQPYKLKGVPKKVPEVIELGLLGSNEEKLKFIQEKLGKEVPVSEVLSPGQFIDALAVTKGKGFQGRIKRFGVKMMKRKQASLKTRRSGTIGGRQTGTRWQVPMPGQMGYHQRCEYNKKLILVGSEPITPKGGFIRYGEVVGDYVLVEGSVPGPTKRLITIRHALRSSPTYAPKPIEITYISRESKQGA